MSNEKWKGHPQRLRALGKRDASWSILAGREKEIKLLSERGFETEKDIMLMKGCLLAVLGEIAWRRGEMKMEQELEE